MPKLSVITINFNDHNGLEKTILSVVSQTFKDFEFILIDGGSTDGSIDIIKRYSNNINYWVSEKDNGIYNAQNKGIAKATGEYCLFINSGDYLVDENVLQNVFSKNHHEDILYGELIFVFFDFGKRLEKLPVKLSLAFLFQHNMWHPATFIKRDLFRTIGMYNEKFKVASDYNFFFNAIAIKKVTTSYLPFPIAIHDTGGISSNSGYFKLIEEERNIIHKMYLTGTEIEYLTNLKKFKINMLARFLVNKPRWTKLFDYMLKKYSQIRN